MEDSNGSADEEGEDGDASDSSSLERTLIVDCGPGYGATTYELSVSGDLEQVDGELEDQFVSGDPGDTIRGSTAGGSVVGCADGFRFSGEITSFWVAAPSQCTVYVDGERVQPRELGTDYEPPLQIDVEAASRTLDPEASTTVWATVTDSEGEPQSDVEVEFRLLDSGRGRGTLDPAGRTTDDDGAAAVTYTAPPVGGIDRIEASAEDASATVGVATRASPTDQAADRPEPERRVQQHTPSVFRGNSGGSQLR